MAIIPDVSLSSEAVGNSDLSAAGFTVGISIGSYSSCSATIPDVSDTLTATGITTIEAAGLVAGTVTNSNHATIVDGNIISTTPPADTVVDLGSTVNILESDGPITPSGTGPIADMPVNTWLEVANVVLDGNTIIDSKLKDHDPCATFPCSWSGNLGVRGIMDVWNGGCWDSYRDRLIVLGGGHDGYAGNELYVFDINTLTWTRLTDPSTVITTPGGSIYSAVLTDGKPLVRHNYNHVQYIPPPVDRLVLTGGCCGFHFSGQGSSHTTKGVVYYHFGAGVGPVGWGSTAIADFDPAGNSAVTGMSSAINVTNNEMWVVPDGGGNNLMRLEIQEGVNFDDGTHTWGLYTNTSGIPIYLTSAIDTTRNNMVSVGSAYGVDRLLVYDLDNPNTAAVNRTNTSTGDTTLQSRGQIGFDYDSNLDKFVGWDGGSQIYTLDPVTWHWERVNVAAGNTVVPTAPNGTGTYGRFRYSANFNCFVLVNRVDENVYLYKASVDPV